MLSFWRNDAERNLRARAAHLLGKSYQGLRWIWVVGDCDPGDDTMPALLGMAAEENGRVTVVPVETAKHLDRYQRLSLTANAGLEYVRPWDDYVLIHESDIISPVNVVERFLAHAEQGRCPIAGWPVLRFPNNVEVFYDIWAYRKDGQMFVNWPPYHPSYHSDRPFTVDSVGTVWMFHAEDAMAGLRCYEKCAVELCNKLREEYGRTIWVDPTLRVNQPYSLWEAHEVKP